MHSTVAALRLLLVTGSVFSVFAIFETAGTVNYQHLLLNYDARSVGMGGASVAMPGGVNGIYANPALLAGVKSRQGYIGYQLIVDGVWGAPLGYAQPSQRGGAIAVMMQGVSSGKVYVIDVKPDGGPDSTGLYAHNEYLTMSFSYGHSFLESRLYAGVTAKGLYHRISNPPQVFSSKGLAFDLGVQYRWVGDRLITGVVVRNLGLEIQQFANSDPYPMPLTIEAGISYVPRYLSALRLALDLNKIRGEYPNVEPGVELTLYPNILFVRFGFMFSSHDFREQLKKFSGDQDPDYIKSNWNTLSTGIGLRTHIRQVYVYTDVGIQFREAWLTPSPVLSAVIDF